MKITPFLNIKCKHNFFTDGNLKSSKIRPSEEALLTMKQLDILSKTDEHGIILGSSESTLDLLRNSASAVKLTFYLEMEDNLFFGKTDLQSMINSRRLLKFDNIDKDIVNNEIILLHDAEYVSEDDLDSIENHSGRIGVNTIGIITIKLEDEGVFRSYEIRFNRRKVFWRYYLIGREQIETQKFEILSSTNDPSFGEPILTTLENGTQAMEITSNNLIDLKEDYNFSLTLKHPSLSNLKMNLPFPKVSNFNMGENGLVYADQYIYL